MIARKRGTRRTAFAGTARLFGSWSEIACPREAYKLVQSFVVDLWRFANAGTDVSVPVHDPVVSQPVVSEIKRSKPKAESSAAGAKQRKAEHEVIELSD
jgi:hypothetical protein